MLNKDKRVRAATKEMRKSHDAWHFKIPKFKWLRECLPLLRISKLLLYSGESKQPFSSYTKWFMTQIAPRDSVKCMERSLILQYKGPILRVNHFTGYHNHLPTWMRCFVTFNALHLNEFLVEAMYVWGKTYGMALGWQLFLSLCEMKEIQRERSQQHKSSPTLPQHSCEFLIWV